MLIFIFSHHYEVFDSLGCKLSFIQEKLPCFAPTVYYNSTQYQSEDSVLCGKFSVTFLLFRLLNTDMTFHEVVDSLFSPVDYSKNDEIVEAFMNI